ncbi:hypothetical protein VAEU17_4400202 [Vibrio aestuarianus]|nr:hypothetical protein VAEU17_4400202 [Vibrio aestuarianus]
MGQINAQTQLASKFITYIINLKNTYFNLYFNRQNSINKNQNRK